MRCDRNSSGRGAPATARLPVSVAAALIGGIALLSPATAAHAAGKPAATADWTELDSAAISIENIPDPVVFTVSARDGVPYIRDPRNTEQPWLNLRRVPGSQGGDVTDITVAQDAPSNYTPDPLTTDALRVTARTAAGIYFTVCRLGTLTGGSIPLPTSGPLPCTPWQPIALN